MNDLLVACENGYEEIALEILENWEECNLGKINKNGNTALMIACNNKLKKVALKMLEHWEECNIGQINEHGNTALIIAWFLGGSFLAPIGPYRPLLAPIA